MYRAIAGLTEEFNYISYLKVAIENFQPIEPREINS